MLHVAGPGIMRIIPKLTLCSKRLTGMLCTKYIASRDNGRLLSSTLSNRQEITITGIGNGHHARQVVSEMRWTERSPRRQLTQLGTASRQRFPRPRSYQQNGEQRSWTTWHSTPAQTSSVGGSSRRSARAWLKDWSVQGTFSASRSSPCGKN